MGFLLRITFFGDRDGLWFGGMDEWIGVSLRRVDVMDCAATVMLRCSIDDLWSGSQGTGVAVRGQIEGINAC